MGEMGEGSQNVQNSSCKISSGHVIYSMMTLINNPVLYI